nr:MAG TPA: hypothetical protein [Caudoviricetes sp.]
MTFRYVLLTFSIIKVCLTFVKWYFKNLFN